MPDDGRQETGKTGDKQASFGLSTVEILRERIPQSQVRHEIVFGPQVQEQREEIVSNLKKALDNFQHFGTQEYREQRMVKASADNGRPLPPEVLDRWINSDRIKALEEAFYNKIDADKIRAVIPEKQKVALEDAINLASQGDLYKFLEEGDTRRNPVNAALFKEIENRHNPSLIQALRRKLARK